MLYLKREMFKDFSEKVGKSFDKIPLTANHWTMLSLVLATITAYFLINQNFLYASLFFALLAFLDMVDGAVARIRNEATKFGAFLDTVVDRVTEFLVVLGLFFVSFPDVFFSSKIWLLLLFFGSQMTTYVKAAASEKKLTENELKGGILERPERLILIFLIVLLLNVSLEYSLYLLVITASLANLTAMQRFYKASRQ